MPVVGVTNRTRIIVKKLISLLLMGSMLLSGVAFGQYGPPPPPNPPDESPDQPVRPSLPRPILNNPELQDFVRNFQDFRSEFKDKMLSFRSELAEASDSEKDVIRESVRNWLREYRSQQRDFRKRVRQIMSEHREASIRSDGGSTGQP